MNWWAIIIIGMWLSGGLGAGLSKDSGCLGWSFTGTLLMGVFYVLLHF